MPFALALGDEPDRSKPPSEFSSLQDIRSWIESHKGFGQPQSIESDLIGMHIYVSWYDPFSGRAADYAYAYYQPKASKSWKLLDSSLFENPSLSHVYIDAQADALVYVGHHGAVLKKVSVKEVRFK